MYAFDGGGDWSSWRKTWPAQINLTQKGLLQQGIKTTTLLLRDHSAKLEAVIYIIHACYMIYVHGIHSTSYGELLSDEPTFSCVHYPTNVSPNSFISF